MRVCVCVCVFVCFWVGKCFFRGLSSQAAIARSITKMCVCVCVCLCVCVCVCVYVCVCVCVCVVGKEGFK